MDWIENQCACRKNKGQSALDRSDTSCGRPSWNGSIWHDNPDLDVKLIKYIYVHIFYIM